MKWPSHNLGGVAQESGTPLRATIQRRLSMLAWSASAVLVAASAVRSASAEVDFRREIRPLLQRHCYECHGPDKRKGGLRLATRADAFTPGDYGVPVITPSDPSLSFLYELITSKDPEERMPKEKPPLPPRDIELIRRWIEEGAVWPAEADDPSQHWAYVKPTRPTLPEVQDRAWPQNEIDRFILARLEKEGIAPAAPADRVTLIRRVYLDLIGLPPSPEEVAAFVQDEAPDAYEKVVDRLLASPRFGERWARLWLDLGRYADSSGFQSDQLRESWPYRDWVVNAINADMPFDQFTIEQIAGDLLPNATAEQKIATGFHRAAPLNLEAGIHVEESRVIQVIDRVNTTSTVWLGSTIECAQCHDHKYDPVSQEDYYRLFAFFNNTPQEAQSLGGLSFVPGGPFMPLAPGPEMASRRRGILERIFAVLDEIAPAKGEEARAQAELRAKVYAFDPQKPNGLTPSEYLRATQPPPRKVNESELAEWLKTTARAFRRGEPSWEPFEVVSFETTGGEDHRLLSDGSILLEGAVPDTSTYIVKVRAPRGGITGFRVDALTDPSLPRQGPGRGDEERPDFVLSEIEVLAARPGETETDVPVRLHSPEASHEKKGEVADAIDNDAATGWSIAERFGMSHWATFLPEGTIGDDAHEAVFTVLLHQSAGFGRTIGRVRISATRADPELMAVPGRIRRTILAASNRRVAQSPQKTRAKLQQNLQNYFATSYVPAAKRHELKRLGLQLVAFQPPKALIMEEMAEPRTTHVFERGNYLSPGKVVEAGTPAVLHPMRPEGPANRLGLARWLVDRENPLVARVVVNRWWAELFGRGIVSSVEDFGAQGELPTHPELLDWLAVDFMDNGWSTKRTLKQIVTSATYRQSVLPESQQVLERDPLNELLARSPRLRLPAEMVRDNALAIAGLLSDRIGGPPVYPPQPDGIWKFIGTFQPRYLMSTGEDRYRRGLYAVWRRSAPYASFTNFDAKDRSTCVVRRSRTNTPLQALTLLNDEAFVEMALGLAQRVLHERPQENADERLRYAFRLAVAREPSPQELGALRDLLDAQSRRIVKDKEAPEVLLAGVRSFTPAPDVDRNELAAWYFVANAILNLDETITRG